MSVPELYSPTSVGTNAVAPVSVYSPTQEPSEPYSPTSQPLCVNDSASSNCVMEFRNTTDASMCGTKALPTDIFAGRIVSWNSVRGFGFIREDNNANSKDVYFCQAGLHNLNLCLIQTGVRVQFMKEPSLSNKYAGQVHASHVWLEGTERPQYDRQSAKTMQHRNQQQCQQYQQHQQDNHRHDVQRTHSRSRWSSTPHTSNTASQNQSQNQLYQPRDQRQNYNPHTVSSSSELPRFQIDRNLFQAPFVLQHSNMSQTSVAPPPPNKRVTGVVRVWHVQDGYGQIELLDESRTRVLLTRACILTQNNQTGNVALQPGVHVELYVQPSVNGLNAIQVTGVASQPFEVLTRVMQPSIVHPEVAKSTHQYDQPYAHHQPHQQATSHFYHPHQSHQANQPHHSYQQPTSYAHSSHQLYQQSTSHGHQQSTPYHQASQQQQTQYQAPVIATVESSDTSGMLHQIKSMLTSLEAGKPFVHPDRVAQVPTHVPAQHVPTPKSSSHDTTPSTYELTNWLQNRIHNSTGQMSFSPTQ